MPKLVLINGKLFFHITVGFRASSSFVSEAPLSETQKNSRAFLHVLREAWGGGGRRGEGEGALISEHF